MKKILLVLTGFLFTFSSFAQNNGYDITVVIDGLDCSSELLLANHYGDKQYLRDTSECVQGQFHFKGNERLETGIYMVVLPKKNYFEFVVSTDEDQTRYYFKTDTNLNQAEIITKGSRENMVFMEFNKFAAEQSLIASKMDAEIKANPDDKKKNDKLKEQLRTIGAKVSMTRQEYAIKNPELFIGKLYASMKEIKVPEAPDGLSEEEMGRFDYLYMRDHFFDNIDFSEDGLVRSPIFHAKLKDYFKNYAPPLIDTCIMLSDRLIGRVDAGGSKEQYKYTVHYLLGFYEKAAFMCFDKGLHHMAKNYYCDGKAFWSDSSFIAKMCEESAKMAPTLCDEIAPDLNMPDSNFNRRIRMSEITTPVTVVVFWDINCGHCKKEMPIISKFYDSCNKEQVELYAVYTQGDWEGWKKRIKKDNFKFINVANAFGEDKFRKKYNIISTPQVYILDKDKRIKFKKIGAKDISGVVNFLLEEQGVIETPDDGAAPKKEQKLSPKPKGKLMKG